MTRLSEEKIAKERALRLAERYRLALYDLALGNLAFTETFVTEGTRFTLHLTRLRSSPVVIVVQKPARRTESRYLGDVEVYDLDELFRETESGNTDWRVSMLSVLGRFRSEAVRCGN